MSRAIRLILIGILTFAVCLIVLAPASLLRFALGDTRPVTLTALTGTLWRGGGDLAVAGTQLGHVTWSFAPMLLVTGQLGFDVAVHGDQLELTGRASTSPTTATAQMHGTFDAALLREPLARYAIELPGSFTLGQLDVTHRYGSRLPLVHGDARWSGGTVDYQLSGRAHRVDLPALVGFIDSPSGQPAITVYQTDDKTPLLLGRLTEDGVGSLGITKQFTKLLGEPWPGSEPDHAVVLEVGEKLF